MFALIIGICLTLASTIALSCPSQLPDGFGLSKQVRNEKLFINKHQTAVLGLKCTTANKNESYKTLQYFPGRTSIDERTSFFSLKGDSNTVSRIYFFVADNKLVQASLTAKVGSAQDLALLESSVLKFIRSN